LLKELTCQIVWYIISKGIFPVKKLSAVLDLRTKWEFAMENCDIILDKKSDIKTIEKELSAKLDITVENDIIHRAAEKLINTASPLKLRIFISTVKDENETINKIIEEFSNAAEKNDNIEVSVIYDEFLNMLDSEGKFTKQSKPRSLVHKDGDPHPTVHIWIIKKTDMGIYVLLQKRSHQKDVFPDCFDVSAAGHVSAGNEYRDCAIRELYEEIGIKAEYEQLEFIGMHSKEYKDENVHDNEIAAIYLYREPIDIDNLKLQISEVSEVRWVDLDECLALIDNPQFKHCISKEELYMIKKKIL